MVQTQFFTTSDGAKLGYRIYGNNSVRPPLVMINGWTALMIQWSPLVEALSQQRKVLIFDHRGIGESTVPSNWDGESLSHSSMALDIISLVSFLGWKLIDVLGFSMGGHITQMLLSHPQANIVQGLVQLGGVRIRKAILTATMTKMPHGDFDILSAQTQMAKFQDKKKAKHWLVTEMLKYHYHPQVLVEGNPLLNVFHKRVEQALTGRRPETIILDQLRSIQNCDVRANLHRIPSTLPVLIIHGKRDGIVSYSESEYIVKGIPHAKRFIPKQGGDQFSHFWYDYFDIHVWTDGINRFLDQQPNAKL